MSDHKINSYNTVHSFFTNESNEEKKEAKTKLMDQIISGISTGQGIKLNQSIDATTKIYASAFRDENLQKPLHELLDQGLTNVDFLAIYEAHGNAREYIDLGKDEAIAVLVKQHVKFCGIEIPNAFPVGNNDGSPIQKVGHTELIEKFNNDPKKYKAELFTLLSHNMLGSKDDLEAMLDYYEKLVLNGIAIYPMDDWGDGKISSLNTAGNRSESMSKELTKKMEFEKSKDPVSKAFFIVGESHSKSLPASASFLFRIAKGMNETIGEKYKINGLEIMPEPTSWNLVKKITSDERLGDKKSIENSIKDTRYPTYITERYEVEFRTPLPQTVLFDNKSKEILSRFNERFSEILKNTPKKEWHKLHSDFASFASKASKDIIDPLAVENLSKKLQITDENKTDFLSDVDFIAKAGVISVVVDALWRKHNYFEFENTVVNYDLFNHYQVEIKY